DLVGEGLALVGLEVGDHDGRAAGGELAGDRSTDARGAAGDDGRRSGEFHVRERSGRPPTAAGRPRPGMIAAWTSRPSPRWWPRGPTTTHRDCGSRSAAGP